MFLITPRIFRALGEPARNLREMREAQDYAMRRQQAEHDRAVRQGRAVPPVVQPERTWVRVLFGLGCLFAVLTVICFALAFVGADYGDGSSWRDAFGVAGVIFMGLTIFCSWLWENVAAE